MRNLCIILLLATIILGTRQAVQAYSAPHFDGAGPDGWVDIGLNVYVKKFTDMDAGKQCYVTFRGYSGNALAMSCN